MKFLQNTARSRKNTIARAHITMCSTLKRSNAALNDICNGECTGNSVNTCAIFVIQVAAAGGNNRKREGCEIWCKIESEYYKRCTLRLFSAIRNFMQN